MCVHAYLIIELSDILLYVWQQSSECELLYELSDAIVVTEGEAGPMAHHPCHRTPSASLGVRGHSIEGVQAPRVAGCIQLERMAIQAVGHAI